MLEQPEDRITEHALRQMSECAASFPGVETGGIGLGRTQYELLDLIPSGPTAERHSGSFSLDPEYLTASIEAARRRGLRWTAVWHVHPEGCPSPSRMDWEAVRSLLHDPDTGLAGRLLLPITMRVGHASFETRFWVAEGPNPDIREIRPVIVSQPTLRASTAARIPTNVALDGLLSTHRDERVREDMQTLRTLGFFVRYRELSQQRRVLHLEKPKLTLYVFLPLEYPLSPPDIFCDERGRACPVLPEDTPSLKSWSSLRELSDVIREAEKGIADTREAETRLLRRSGIARVCRAMPYFGR